MKTGDIQAYFLKLADWQDPAKSPDKIIVGDPEKDVRTCLVTWISSLRACRIAVERGVDMLVTHEPTYYDGWDDWARAGVPEPPTVKRKRDFLERSGLVILRVHNAWDCFPGEGVPWAWARFLGFSGEPVRTGDIETAADACLPGKTRPPTMLRYDVEPTNAGELARRFAARTAELGEPVLQLIGDPAAQVSRIGVGTGCWCSPRLFMEMGCDCSIACDDGSSYWRFLQLAEDAGFPVIRVNHGTSEEPAMATLARHMTERLPGVRAEYLPHRPAYRPVGPAGLIGD